MAYKDTKGIFFRPVYWLSLKHFKFILLFYWACVVLYYSRRLPNWTRFLLSRKREVYLNVNHASLWNSDIFIFTYMLSFSFNTMSIIAPGRGASNKESGMCMELNTWNSLTNLNVFKIQPIWRIYFGLFNSYPDSTIRPKFHKSSHFQLNIDKCLVKVLIEHTFGMILACSLPDSNVRVVFMIQEFQFFVNARGASPLRSPNNISSKGVPKKWSQNSFSEFKTMVTSNI